MEEILPDAYAELQEAVVLFSPAGDPIACNARTETLLGYPLAEFTQVSMDELIAPHADLTAEEIYGYIREAIDGEPNSFEWQIQRANGETRWIEARVSRATFENDQYVLSELQDLTAYKAQERRLQLLYRVLRHNLRNEMNVILGYAENLQNAIAADDLEQQIEIIRNTAEDVGALSQSVADLERLVEQDATERTRTTTADVVERAISEIREEYPAACIDVKAETNALVNVDEGFRVALEHAVSNAIEHNDSAEPNVTVQLDATEREAIVRITDDGPGIPEIELTAIKSSPDEIEQVNHGDGLGLSIMQWCMESLGGNTSIDTADGEGTAVELYLPRLRQRDDDRSPFAEK